jgi:hypothetical protein
LGSLERESLGWAISVNQGISTVNHAATVMTAKALNGGVDAVNHDDNYHEETAMTAKINCRKEKFG